MSRSKTQSNSADFPSDATICDLTTDKKAAKALDNAKSKYGHLVPTVIFRAADGRHLLVRVRCTVPGCETERVVATSDVFQTRTCVPHRGWDKDAAPKAEKTSPKPSKTEEAPKQGRKSRRAPKASPRARKGKTLVRKGA